MKSRVYFAGLKQCVLVLIAVYMVKGQGRGKVTLTTELGNITGIRRTVEHRYVYEFRKIPFAKPPLGNLRFEKPVKFDSWTGTLDATAFGPSCYQPQYPTTVPLPNQDISEDCLHLNIYVPNDITPGVKQSVMVWIHGGGFAFGQGMQYDGSYLAVTGNVIVVTINYRLGVLGFFSTGNEVARGNYGLWDQIMAIQWVKDNIGSYGGDNSSITIFGESAGGMSVGLLSVMPYNKGLFQRAILQSGTGIFSFDDFNRYTNLTYTKVALNCTNDNLSIVKECMKQLKVDQFVLVMQMPFLPVIDGELLTEDPKKLINNANSEASLFFQSIDVMIGTCSSDGVGLIAEASVLQPIYRFNITDGLPKAVLCNYLATNIGKHYGDSAVSTAICNEYGKAQDSDELSMDILNAYTDYYFNMQSVRALRFHLRGLNQANRYHYLFSRRPSTPLFYPVLPPWFTGAAHGDELVYLFNINMTAMSTDDQKLAETLTKYWANFAKSGDVNSGNLPRWEEYDSRNGHYIELDVNITSGQHLFKKRMDFWLVDIPRIIQPVTTIKPISGVKSVLTNTHSLNNYLLYICILAVPHFLS